MRAITSDSFLEDFSRKNNHFPWAGQLELTYKCNLKCIHCYCRNLHNFRTKDENKELSTKEWKGILDQIRDDGCAFLIFTGGEPLIRSDFLELYLYAKKKGFIISIFTNGAIFSDEIITYLKNFLPYSIEITLNGITRDTYEKITQVEGSFSNVMINLKKLAANNLPIIIKSNCLKQNVNEIVLIKKFTDGLLGKAPAGKYYFKYDPSVYPRLDGDRTNLRCRLSFEKLKRFKKQDVDIWSEYRRGFRDAIPKLPRNSSFLYHCSSWLNSFFIDPYGKIKFCEFSDKFSFNLKEITFRKGFYERFPKLLAQKFKTNSKCKNCDLRSICHNCPARAFLETGNEESEVPYYCNLAKEVSKNFKKR